MLASYVALCSSSLPLYTLPYLALNASKSPAPNFCCAVCTSKQMTSSPFCSVAAMCTSTLARLGGMTELVWTSTGIWTVPALRGYGTAFTVILPTPIGRVHTMSEVASPSHEVSSAPRADTVALKCAEVTSSSTVPVPVRVSVAPVWIVDGDTSVTVACLAPQSDHVTAKVPASAVAKPARAKRNIVRERKGQSNR